MPTYAASHKLKWAPKVRMVALMGVAILGSQTAWGSGGVAAANGSPANTPADSSGGKAAHSEVSATAADLQELKELLQAQSAQLQKLTKTVEDQQEEIRALKADRSAGASNAGVLAAASALPAGAITTGAAIGPVIGSAIGPAVAHSSSASQSSAAQ